MIQSFPDEPHLQRLVDAGAWISKEGSPQEARDHPFTSILFERKELSAGSLVDVPNVSNLHEMEFRRCRFRPGALVPLRTCDPPISILFHPCEIPNRLLADLDGGKGIGALHFTDSSVSDSTFRGLTSFPSLWEFECQAQSLTSAGLRFLENCPDLTDLVIPGAHLDDDDLALLLRNKDLVWLNISATMITDESMHMISTFTKLQFLWLDGCSISDEGLTQLKSLGKLRLLGLSGTNITDRGLKSLSLLKELETLNLANTKTTDAGAAALAQLPKLKNLSIRGTEMREAAVETALGRQLMFD